MDPFVFWKQLCRRSPRPEWMIGEWLTDLFSHDEVRLLERTTIELTSWPSRARENILCQFERLGFLFILDGWKPEDRLARVYAAAEVAGLGRGHARQEWPLGLTDDERYQMGARIDVLAETGFREFHCALLVRLEQEFEPVSDECRFLGGGWARRQPIAPLSREDVSMFGVRWVSWDEAAAFLPSLGNGALVRRWCALPEETFPAQKDNLLRPSVGGRFGINRTLVPIDAWTPEVARQRHRFLADTLKAAWQLPLDT